MEFTSKRLVELLEIKQQNIDKALKEIDYELKKIEGSSKKVKHYKLQDLPHRYIEKIKAYNENNKEDSSSALLVPEPKKEEPKLNFTSIYLNAPTSKQNEATLKCRVVELYLKKDTCKTASDFLENINDNFLEFEVLGDITKKQLYDWRKKYLECSAKGTNVVEAFIDVRGRKKGSTILSQEQQDVAERYFLKTSIVNIQNIYLNMCHRYGSMMPSYDALYNYHKVWKKKNYQLSIYANSPDDWKNKCMVAFGNISEKAKYRNQFWELDSTPADVICDDGKRYAVLGMIDVYSRRCVYMLAETSNSYSISQLVRKAILLMGIPENVVIDNGKDYKSNHFASICTALKIHREIVPPFSGDMKPHIERVFGTMTRELFAQLDGFVGHSVAHKMKLKARKSFGDKIISQQQHLLEQRAKTPEQKEAFKDAWKIKKENVGLELTVLYSPTKLQSLIDTWNTNIYEQRIHKGIKAKPIDKWHDSTIPVNVIADTRMLDLLLGESVIRKVGKKGISLDGCVYQDIKLVEYIGSTVQCLVPTDFGKILVYSEDMKPICVAVDEEHLGEHRYKAKQAKKESMKLARQYDAIVKAIDEHNDTDIVDRIEDTIIDVEIITPKVLKRTEHIDMLVGTNSYISKTKPKELNIPKEEIESITLPSGRPVFKSFIQRFVWDLENDMVDKSTNKLAEKYPDMWDMANDEYK